jgi:GNAT superfamily N-acetyltransferase
MSNNSDHRAALRAIRDVLAADCACAPHDFLAGGLVITSAVEQAGRRRFPFPAKPLWVFSMGAGVVISCSPERMPWIRANLGSLDRDAIFAGPAIGRLARYIARDGQDLGGPDLKYTCSAADLRPVAIPDDVTLSVVEGDGVTALYRHAGFDEALHYRSDHPRPDVAAVVAQRGGHIVGIAGAKADCASLWQIGVNVVEDARGQGIGRAVVGRLTEVILEKGKVPYYSTAVSNIASRTVAIRLGYWPAWVELYARDRRLQQPPRGRADANDLGR